MCSYFDSCGMPSTGNASSPIECHWCKGLGLVISPMTGIQHKCFTCGGGGFEKGVKYLPVSLRERSVHQAEWVAPCNVVSGCKVILNYLGGSFPSLNCKDAFITPALSQNNMGLYDLAFPQDIEFVPGYWYLFVVTDQDLNLFENLNFKMQYEQTKIQNKLYVNLHIITPGQVDLFPPVVPITPVV